VQSHCRVCPVCKAGIDDEKVQTMRNLCIRLAVSRPTAATDCMLARAAWCWRPPTSTAACLASPDPLSCMTPALISSVMCAQNCIPIYGRGGDNADPRKKMGGSEQLADSKDAGEAVPRRPAGQRPAPVQAST
jgi:hypothetical protein